MKVTEIIDNRQDFPLWVVLLDKAIEHGTKVTFGARNVIYRLETGTLGVRLLVSRPTTDGRGLQQGYFIPAKKLDDYGIERQKDGSFKLINYGLQPGDREP